MEPNEMTYGQLEAEVRRLQVALEDSNTVSEDTRDLEAKVVEWELRYEDSETRRHQATAQAARLLGQSHAAMHVIADELGIEIDNYNDEDLINMVFLLIRKDRLV